MELLGSLALDGSDDRQRFHVVEMSEFEIESRLGQGLEGWHHFPVLLVAEFASGAVHGGEQLGLLVLVQRQVVV